MEVSTWGPRGPQAPWSCRSELGAFVEGWWFKAQTRGDRSGDAERRQGSEGPPQGEAVTAITGLVLDFSVGFFSRFGWDLFFRQPVLVGWENRPERLGCILHRSIDPGFFPGVPTLDMVAGQYSPCRILGSEHPNSWSSAGSFGGCDQLGYRALTHKCVLCGRAAAGTSTN